MADADYSPTFMQTAIALAEQGRGFVEPNPVVGAVVVKDGRIVGEGWHGHFGGPHAEVYALENAGAHAKGATLYVTLEPCAHQGKTAPCAPRVVSSGVSRVVIAVLDPTEKTHGKGVALLRANGIDVQVGMCCDEAARQNAAFFKQSALGRPLVNAKWAMTLDGKIATRTGHSQWISCQESRQYVHELRSRVDCVMVGAGTVRADDPSLTCRLVPARRKAVRVVVCGRRAIPLDSRLAATAGDVPVLVAYAAETEPEGLHELAATDCELLPVERDGDHNVNLTALLDQLAQRDISNILVEGGGAFLGALFDARLVDRATVFVAPRIAGGSAALTPVAGLGVESMDDAQGLCDWTWRRMGDDMLLEGWLADPLEWVR